MASSTGSKSTKSTQTAGKGTTSKPRDTDIDSAPKEYTTESRHEGVVGQVMYPEKTVDAERAAAFAGGKVDTLNEEDDDDGR